MSPRAINDIRRLYDQATAATVERDLQRAVEILKTLPDEETRERAAVFMDGLSQMRSEAPGKTASTAKVGNCRWAQETRPANKKPLEPNASFTCV